MNGVAPIGDLFVGLAGLLNSLFCVAKNLVWIFGARIVGSQDYHIAQRSGRFTHRRALAAITISATAKQRDDSPLSYFTRRSENIQQRIIRVRVIDDDCEIAIVRHTLKSSGGASAFRQGFRDDIKRVAERQATRDGCKRVVDMGRPNQWRMKINLGTV